MIKISLQNGTYVECEVIDIALLPEVGDNQKNDFAGDVKVSNVINLGNFLEQGKSTEAYDIYEVYYKSKNEEENELYDELTGYYYDVEVYAIAEDD